MKTKNLIIVFFLSFSVSFANIDESIFSMMKEMIDQGQYEEALLEGKTFYKKYETTNPELSVIASALMSKASYLWYNFNLSDKYFRQAQSLWHKLDSVSTERYVSGVYLAESAIRRHEIDKARQILNSLEGFNAVSPRYIIFHDFLNIECFNYLGEYESSLLLLEKLKIEVDKIYLSYKPTHFKLMFDWHLLRFQVQQKYGNWSEADSSLAMLKKISNENNLKTGFHLFSISNTEATMNYERGQYGKATQKFLEAFNNLQSNEEEYRKYESLKMASISALKAGSYSEFKKLFRRSDMLSFRKLGRTQLFRPAVNYLKVMDLMHTGQFKLAISKCNESIKKFRFIPQLNPYLIDFNAIKAEAAAHGGLLNVYVAQLDTLEKLTEQKYGQNSIHWHLAKLKYADFQARYMGSLPQANDLYIKHFLGYVAKKYHPNSPYLLGHLAGFADLSSLLNKNDSAYFYSQKGLNISNKSFGKNSAESQYFRAQNALYAFNIGKYKSTVDTVSKITNTPNNSKIEQNPYYLYSLFTLTELNQWLGEFQKSEQLINKALLIVKSSEDVKYYEKSLVLDNLTKNYIFNSNYLRAEKNNKAAINLKKPVVFENGYMMLASYIDKINLKVLKGDLKDANTAIETTEKVLPLYFNTESKPNATFLFYKAKYFIAIADYKKARETLLSSIDIHAKIYGSQHIRLAPLYTELAQLTLSENSKNIKEADDLYEKAKKLVENALGTQNPTYANLLVKQAILLSDNGSYDRAFGNLQSAEKFWTSKLGSQNTYIAEINYIRGNTYYKQKAYSQATKSYETASYQYGTIFNKSHIGYLNANTGIAKVAYMQKDAVKAAAIMEPILQARLKFTDNNFSIMSFNQKTGFWALFKEEFEFYNAVALELFNTKKDISKTSQMYNFALKTKGLLLNSDAKIRRQVFQSGDSTLIANFNDWMESKEYFALISSYSNAQLEEEKIDIIKVESELLDLEKKINSKTNGSLEKNTDITWIDVKSVLQPNAMAIEMIRVRHFNHVFTDTARYVGLIIESKTKEFPDAVVLDNGKKMEKGFLNYYRNATISRSEDENSYDAFFAPLKTKIPDGYTVFFASEGVYSQLNIEMLYNTTTKKYALENNAFVFVTNTRDVIPAENSKSTFKKATQDYYLYGNPDFYLNESITLKDQSVPSLVGAEQEVNQIAELLKKSGKNTIHMIGNVITEDTVKALDSPTVLHVSTHGFFMERTKGGNEVVNNPMLNSGLMLAGSGDILHSSADTYINQKSGILTASEVMDLNFTNTNLVVLSACETGRGQIEVGEGVFGLQRAFLVAGAKSIILSLFKVDDDATQTLMTKFYDKFLNNGGDYRKAFREAKYELRNSEKFASPVFWGAFVMIEGQQVQGKNL